MGPDVVIAFVLIAVPVAIVVGVVRWATRRDKPGKEWRPPGGGRP